MNLLQEKIKEITTLCELSKVKSLFAFGSVLTADFNSESDIDLLVEIKSNDPLDYSDNYFKLKFQLEKLFNRPIDLLEIKSLKNSFVKQQIDSTKILLYAA